MKKPSYLFGNPAILKNSVFLVGPVALRPPITRGLRLSFGFEKLLQTIYYCRNSFVFYKDNVRTDKLNHS